MVKKTKTETDKLKKNGSKTSKNSLSLDDLSSCEYFNHDGISNLKKASRIACENNIKLSDMKKTSGEKGIVSKILEWLNSLPRCKARKVHGNMYVSGEPDIDCVINGLSVKIEVKQPGEKPTPKQLNRINEWSDAGCLAFWSDSLELVQKTLKDNKYI